MKYCSFDNNISFVQNISVAYLLQLGNFNLSRKQFKVLKEISEPRKVTFDRFVFMQKNYVSYIKYNKNLNF